MSDNARLVLREAELAREGRLDTQHAPFAEHQLRVPIEHWHALTRLYPGLASRQRQEFEDAYKQLLQSPFADRYRVRKRQAQLGHL